MLYNPSFVYAFVWILSFFLFSRGYSDLFLELTDSTKRYISLSVFSVFCGYLFCFVLFLNKTKIKKTIPVVFMPKVMHRIRYLVVFWLFFSLVEVVYFRDLPILAVFGLGTITYHDFGLPSLHGFLNAIVLSLSMYSLYLYLAEKNNKYLFYYLLTLGSQVIAMNRGGLTSLLIESVFVYLVFFRLNFKAFVFFVLFVSFFVIAFGYFGEVRNVSNSDDLYAVFSVNDKYPDFLPKQLLWVYMYMASPINNIINVIELSEDVKFAPYNAIFGLIPSVFRMYLDEPVKINLVVNAFNVSSFLPNYLAAFGFFGSLIYYFIGSFFSNSIYYFYRISRRIDFGFVLVIFLHSTALSVFSDFYSLQVYLFQVLLQFYVFRRS